MLFPFLEILLSLGICLQVLLLAKIRDTAQIRRFQPCHGYNQNIYKKRHPKL